MSGLVTWNQNLLPMLMDEVSKNIFDEVLKSDEKLKTNKVLENLFVKRCISVFNLTNLIFILISE